MVFVLHLIYPNGLKLFLTFSKMDLINPSFIIKVYAIRRIEKVEYTAYMDWINAATSLP